MNQIIRLLTSPFFLTNQSSTVDIMKSLYAINLLDSRTGSRFKSFIGDSGADDGVKGNTIVIHRHTKASTRRAGGGVEDRRLPGVSETQSVNKAIV